MSVGEDDPLQVARAPAEPPDRVEDTGAVGFEERVDERQLAARLQQEGANAAALRPAETVDSLRELPHAPTRVQGANAFSTPRSAGSSSG